MYGKILFKQFSVLSLHTLDKSPINDVSQSALLEATELSPK